MIERIILNGEAYLSAGDIPGGMGDRVRELANHPIWNHLPDGLMLVVSTVNMTPSTWLTVDVDHLSTLSPAAVGTLPVEKANTPAARKRRVAEGLVDLYVSHYNSTLFAEEADQLVALAGDVPEEAAKRLTTLFRPFMNGVHVEMSEARDALPHDVSDEERELFDSIPSSGLPGIVNFARPVDLNPTLQNDGSIWRLDIPQSLYVEIREAGPADEKSLTPHEPLGVFSVEARRVIRYVGNESRAPDITATGRSVYTGWSDDIPEPPSVNMKTFQTAVTAQRPINTASSMFRTSSIILIIGTFTIIAFIVIVLTSLLIMLD